MRCHGAAAVLAGALIATDTAAAAAIRQPVLPTPGVTVSVPAVVPRPDPSGREQPRPKAERSTEQGPARSRPARDATTAATRPPVRPAGAADATASPSGAAAASATAIRPSSSGSAEASPGRVPASADGSTSGGVWLAGVLLVVLAVAFAVVVRRRGRDDDRPVTVINNQPGLIIRPASPAGPSQLPGYAEGYADAQAGRPPAPGEVSQAYAVGYVDGSRAPREQGQPIGLDPESLDAARRIARRLSEDD